MAVIQTNLRCELQETVKVQYLDGVLFSQDNQANQINVAVYENGEPASITGDVTANVIRSDGGTVAVSGGTISDNVASISLPSAAYYVPGVISVIVKLTTDSVITTIAAVVANVYRSSTDTAVDPGTIIPSIQTLISSIETAVSTIPLDYSALNRAVKNIDSVIFKVPYSVSLGNLVESGYLNPANGYNGSNNAKYTRTGFISLDRDIVVKLDSDNYQFCIWTYSSQSTSSKIESPTFSQYVNAENPIIIEKQNYFRIGFKRKDDTNLTTDTTSPTSDFSVIASSFKAFEYTDKDLNTANIPADSKAVGERIDDVSPFNNVRILWEQGQYRTDTGGAKTSSVICRTIGIVMFHDYLQVVVPSGYKLQYLRYTGISYTTFTGASDYMTGTVTIKDDGAYYKLNIAKTDDSEITPSDVYALIMLCKVGIQANRITHSDNDNYIIYHTACTYTHIYFDEGVYTIAGTVTIPDDVTIEGVGFGTVIRFADAASGACFKLGNRCCVKNMQIVGRDTDYVIPGSTPSGDDVPTTMGTRHGIEITGQVKRGTIDNVYIHGFDGYCIYAHDNGTASDQGYNIANCFLYGSHGGLMLKSTAEFFRVVSCDMTGNYIGLFYSGANNNLSCCNISSNMNGVYIDRNRTDGNHAHSSINNCSIQHNKTRAIYINNCYSGLLFTGCNIDQGGLEAIGSAKIVFDACNFMDLFTLTINGKWNSTEGLILFGNSIFNETIFNEGQVSITDNNRVRFANCYTSKAEVVDPTQA